MNFYKGAVLLGFLISASLLSGCGKVAYIPCDGPNIAPNTCIAPVKDQTLKLSTGTGKTVVTLFADFQCPGCQAFHKNSESVLTKMAQSGSITFERKNYPLPMHPSAYKDALGGLCAASAGKYSEYRDMMYQTETDRAKNGQFKVGMSASQIALLSEKIGFDGAKMEECINNKWYEGDLKSQQAQADKWKLSATPSIYVDGALLQANAQDPEELKKVIENYIAQKK